MGRDTVNQDQPSRRIDAPEPGFFRLRLVPRGPWVAARIYSRFGVLAAEINGAAASIDTVWAWGEFITSEQYGQLLANPPSLPDQPLHLSTAGMAQRMRQEAEWLALQRRSIE